MMVSFQRGSLDLSHRSHTPVTTQMDDSRLGNRVAELACHV